MHRIAITNMTGGRNRGCEALVSSIADGLRQELGGENVRLSLHTQDAAYDRDHLAAAVHRIHSTSNLPPARFSPRLQRGCLRAARWAARTPMRRYVPVSVSDGLRADLLVATGGDTFTSDYRAYERHARILHFGTPVAMLAHTIGPFNKKDAKLFVASTRNIAICTVRDSETLDYVTQLAPHLEPELTADVAFRLPAVPPEAAREIIEVDHRFPIAGRRLVGLSISAGVLTYRTGVEESAYLTELAAFIDDLNRTGWSVILLPHVQETWKRNNDIYACRDVFKRVAVQSDNVILQAPMSAADFKGVIGLCRVLVGARMHTAVASLSQGIPTVAIAYSRKARALMRDFYGPALASELTLEAASLDRQRLREAFDRAVSIGMSDSRAAEMRTRAGRNFVRIREFLQRAG